MVCRRFDGSFFPLASLVDKNTLGQCFDAMGAGRPRAGGIFAVHHFQQTDKVGFSIESLGNAFVSDREFEFAQLFAWGISISGQCCCLFT